MSSTVQNPPTSIFIPTPRIAYDTKRIKLVGKKLRDEFVCPITMELYRDPVVASDGHTYERIALEKWTNTYHTSPRTREPMSMDTTTSNMNLKKLIQDMIVEGGSNLYGISNDNIKRAFYIVPQLLLYLKCLGPPESEWYGRSQEINRYGCLGGRKVNNSKTSSKQMDLMVFNDNTISRSHFEINYSKSMKQYMIRDLGSAGGTYIRIPHGLRRELSEGMLILIGKHQFQVAYIGTEGNKPNMDISTNSPLDPSRMSQIKEEVLSPSPVLSQENLRTHQAKLKDYFHSTSSTSNSPRDLLGGDNNGGGGVVAVGGAIGYDTNIDDINPMIRKGAIAAVNSGSQSRRGSVNSIKSLLFGTGNDTNNKSPQDDSVVGLRTSGSSRRSSRRSSGGNLLNMLLRSNSNDNIISLDSPNDNNNSPIGPVNSHHVPSATLLSPKQLSPTQTGTSKEGYTMITPMSGNTNRTQQEPRSGYTDADQTQTHYTRNNNNNNNISSPRQQSGNNAKQQTLGSTPGSNGKIQSQSSPPHVLGNVIDMEQYKYVVHKMAELQAIHEKSSSSKSPRTPGAGGSGDQLIRNSGATVRNSGATVRNSGANMRNSGATVRNSGATVRNSLGISNDTTPSINMNATNQRNDMHTVRVSGGGVGNTQNTTSPNTMKINPNSMNASPNYNSPSGRSSIKDHISPRDSPRDPNAKICILTCYSPDGSPLQGKSYMVDIEGATLGRRSQNKIPICMKVEEDGIERVVNIDNAISAEHARITYDKSLGKFFIQDGTNKASTNGTWQRLSGAFLVSKPYILESGMEILIGNVRFLVGSSMTIIEEDLE